MSALPRATVVRDGTPLSCVLAVLLSALLVPAAAAQIPPGYYDSVDTGSPAAMRATLHDVIDDHLRFPYTSGGTDTWDILEVAMQDPSDSGRILDVYENESHPKQGGGNSFYDREHTWPKSYGFPDDNSSNYPYTDCHMLWLTDPGYNSARSNRPFRNCDSGCTEYPTFFNGGQGGLGGSPFPGDSNWGEGSFTSGSWETWMGRRGDVARAVLYADLRYEGGTHGVTGVSEPDLILTDIEALIAASNTGNNEPVAYMGMLAVILQWHAQDPPDDWERQRNDVVGSHQGNRNPFVDHPEWATCIFESNCGGGPDLTPPAAPTGLVGTPAAVSAQLDWNDNGEPDLNGYSVYRALVSGGPYAPVSSLLPVSDHTDPGLTASVSYFYVVTASDTSFNESGFSSEVEVVPTQGGGTPSATPWLNELHYDNTGSDTGEFFEIAGPAGFDLAGWDMVLYNGNGGGTYDTVALSGVLVDQQGCFGTKAFFVGQIQNGAPDGLALVDPQGAVLDFLSYEGVIVASGGPASGMTSTNIGVSESSSTPVGFSLQLTGTGSTASDFTWAAPQAETDGLPNNGQTFICSSSPWVDLGFAKSGVAGLPSFTGVGTLVAGTPYELLVADGAPSALAVMFVALSSTPVPFKGGMLVAFPPLFSLTLGTDPAGGISLPGTWPGGVPPGFVFVLQTWIVDLAATQGLSATNGLEGTTP